MTNHGLNASRLNAAADQDQLVRLFLIYLAREDLFALDFVIC